MYVCVCVRAYPWTVAHQTPLSIGFSRPESWKGLPFPTPGDPPDSGIDHGSLESPTLASGLLTTEPPEKPHILSSAQSSHSVVSDSLQPHESQQARPPCPSPTPGVYSNSCPLSR